MRQEGVSYDAVIRRAMENAGGMAAARPASAVAFAEQLVAASRAERRCLLKEYAPAVYPDLVQHLLGRATKVRERDLGESMRLARRALEVALRAVRVFPQTRIAADLCVEALAYLANLQRIQGCFSSAERLWRKVHLALSRGSGDRLLQIDALRMQAALRRSQRRFHEATDLLRAALRFQAKLGDPHGEGKLRVALGIAFSYTGKPQQAFDEVLRALELLDSQRDPELYFRAVHPSVQLLADLGRYDQALLMAMACEVAYPLVGDRRLTLRGRWIKGRLHARCHERAEAIEYLDSVRVGFQKEGLAYEAALSTLDLALVHAEEHDLRKVKQLVEEMYPVFVDKAIPREAAASLLLFADSARRSGATAAQVSKVIDQLHALRLH